MRIVRRIGRYFKEGFYGVARHSAMAISSASAVMITLTIICVFAIFSFSLDSITRTIEETVQISVKINFDYESQEQLDKINTELMSIEGVANTTFFTKEQELEFYIELNSDDEASKAIFEPYVEDNPFHHMYYIDLISGEYVQSVSDAVLEIEGIDEVNYGGESTITLISALTSLRTAGAILVLALGLLAISLISNTIKLTIYARSTEISIMRNVGATNGYIRMPFMIEGIIIGIIGSIIPILFGTVGYIYLYDILGGVWLSNLFVMIQPMPFVLYLAGLLVGTGIIVGLIGSFFSVTRYLRWKR